MQPRATLPEAAANHTSVPSRPKEKNTLLLIFPDGGNVNDPLPNVPGDPNEIIIKGTMSFYTLALNPGISLLALLTSECATQTRRPTSQNINPSQ